MKRYWIKFHSKRLVGLKLKIATWLDKKYPGKYCWAACVAWAYNYDSLNPFKIDSSKACKIESITHPHKLCYCGGWENGKCFALLPKEEQKEIIEKLEKESKESPAELPF